MKIGIDLRFYDITKQGFGRYSAQLLSYLIKFETKHTFVLFLSKEATVPSLPENFSIRRVSVRWYSLQEQIVWPFILLKEKLDLMHFVHFNVPIMYRKKYIVTIHDLLLLHERSSKVSSKNVLLYYIKYWSYRLTLINAVLTAKHIITVSNFVRSEVISMLRVNSKKITAVPLAADFGDISAQSGEKENNVLYVGNAYPHKNLDMLIKGFITFNRDAKYTFTLIGKYDFFYSKLRDRYKNNHDIRFLGEVTDKELSEAYSNAKVFITASKHEGFGLPPLEAMAHKTPVVSSKMGSLPEVLGNAAYYIDELTPNGISKALDTVLHDTALQDELVRKGYEQSKRFSWEDFGKSTVSVYDNV